MKFFEKHPILIFVAIILAIWFYWFQVRPSKIKSLCNKIAINQAVGYYKSLYPNNSDGTYMKSTYEGYYKECLREKGL